MTPRESRQDYAQASGVFRWLIEPRSRNLRNSRTVALVLALQGPDAWGLKTFAEVAAREGVSTRTLQTLRAELRCRFGLRGPAHVFSDPRAGVDSHEAATSPDFASMGLGDDDAFFSDSDPL